MILESGVSKWLALGVVFEDYTHPLPGRAQGTVGFHTGERTIWSTNSEGTLSKTTIKGILLCVLLIFKAPVIYLETITRICLVIIYAIHGPHYHRTGTIKNKHQ